MLFNKSRKYDFMPEIQISQGENLEVIEEFKILGIVISTDLKWNKHIEYICKRGFMKLWTLRRLKKLGASTSILLDIYHKHIRSILEYAAPAWSPMITDENCEEIERVQKSAYAIIFGPNNYMQSLEKSDNVTLQLRRSELSNKFATKSAANTTFSEWFVKKDHVVNTRNQATYKEIHARCERWFRSPIPHMTRLLNSNK